MFPRDDTLYKLGGDFVVVYSLFVVAPIVCGHIVFDFSSLQSFYSGWMSNIFFKSSAIILLRKISLEVSFAVMWLFDVLCLFLSVPWVDLWYMVLVLPVHTCLV